ncbi:MAG TPA: phage major capsid protein [Hymenobacter sp.]|jgi:HK97 family phage major capsid protein
MDIEKLEADFKALKNEAETLLSAETVSADDEAKAEANFASMESINKRISAYKKLDIAFAAGTPVVKSSAKFEAIKPAVTAEYDYAEFSADASEWVITGARDADFATITTATNDRMFVPKNILAPVTSTLGNAFRAGVTATGGTVISTTDAGDTFIPVLAMAAGDKITSEQEDDTTNPETHNEPTGGLLLKAQVYSSKGVWLSNNQIAALNYNLFDYLLGEMVDAKEQALEIDIVAYLNGLTLPSNQIVTPASQTAVTFPELAKARRAGSRRYDSSKFAVFSVDLFNAAESMVDTSGKPLMYVDPQNGELVKFMGIPIYKSDVLTGMNGYVISNKGFRLRDVEPARLARYSNNPYKRDQQGAELFQSHGFGAVEAAVTRIFKAPA